MTKIDVAALSERRRRGAWTCLIGGKTLLEAHMSRHHRVTDRDMISYYDVRVGNFKCSRNDWM